ncbi:MAG: group II intron reverse transcriptase/maturase [Acidobacteria bacterium]|nr:MAG: group II intron reverse transcriptase/maturase [Acidobacteriota bacterium]
MYENLMEEAVQPENCERALKAVKSNKGAPGIDGMTTSELEGHLARYWEKIRSKLLTGTYQPTPVKRVEIEKPGGGTRLLGIPTVVDRFIQQLLLQVLTPIYEPWFSEFSWGFRPGRQAHDAVRAAQAFVRAGKDWVVDFDLEKFFDRVNHDILMTRIGQTIRDKRVLKLIGGYLRSGVMINGVVIETEEGTPQGGPLSPLLSNIYLDPLDRELEKRGHSFSRYADDCNIYVGSEPAAKRVMETITAWISTKLRLKVNASKSGIGRPWERKFLGFCLTEDGAITASPKSLDRFKARVRELWDARRSRTSEELKEEWQSYVRGWWNYYRLAEWRRPIFSLEGWIRRHIRKCFWQRWHSRRGRLRALRRLGLGGFHLKVASSSKGAWRIAASPSLQTALRNSTLLRYGFLVPSDFARAEGA